MMREEMKVPGHWEVKRLGEVCDKISLNGIKIKQKDYLAKGKFPVVDQGQDLIGGYYNDESVVVPNEPPYIIFGDHTKVKKYITFKFIAGADGVKVLKPHSVYDPKFFFYLIHMVKIPDKGYARHFQFLEKEEIPLPPLPEQRAIVARIEQLLSDLENGKQQLLKAQEQLKVYRQSLLKAAFEGKPLLPFEEFVESSQNGLSKRTGTDGIEYKVLRLADISNNKINDSSPRKILMDENEIAKYKIKENDLICVRVNGSKDLVGKLVYVSNKNEQANWAFCDHFIRFTLNPKKAVAKFIHYYFLSLKVRKYIHDNMVTSAGQNTVSQGTIKNVLIPNCPISEQQRIVDMLESKLTLCDKIQETIAQSLSQTETLRQSILKKAFEGKLTRPNEKDNV